MKKQTILIGFGAMLMLSPLSVHAGSPDKSKSDLCALLKPADLTKLLGATPIAKPNADGCSWTSLGSTKKLNAITYDVTGQEAEMGFMGAKMNAARSGKVIDEAGFGDKAFASLQSFGVALMTLKHGRLFTLRYSTGASGTAKDLDALRPVAKKAVAAF